MATHMDLHSLTLQAHLRAMFHLHKATLLLHKPTSQAQTSMIPLLVANRILNHLHPLTSEGNKIKLSVTEEHEAQTDFIIVFMQQISVCFDCCSSETMMCLSQLQQIACLLFWQPCYVPLGNLNSPSIACAGTRPLFCPISECKWRSKQPVQILKYTWMWVWCPMLCHLRHLTCQQIR